MTQEFMEIMRLMNNGLNNDSTLKEVYPRIVNLSLSLNPSVVDYVSDCQLEEACFSSPHPGLNEAILASTNMINNYKNQNQMTR